MKKPLISLILCCFLVSAVYVQKKGWDNTKLELFRFLAYFTISNNPLLKSLDTDLIGIDESADGLRVDLDLLISGGLSKGGVKSIDMPIMLRPDETDFPDDAIITGVFHNNEARAYPHGILNWHEVVNDWIGDTPISVTLCPLCDTNPVFVRSLNNTVLTFGVSGKLYQSCLVLYDKETDSLWAQPWGIGIAGKFSSQYLERLPAAKTTWGKWKNKHPDSLILSKRTGQFGDYTTYPYGDYNTNDAIVFPVKNRDKFRKHPKTPIVMIWDRESRSVKNGYGGASMFLNVEDIRQQKEIQTDFQGRTIIATWDEDIDYPRVYSDSKEIPASASFLFVYYAMFTD